MIISLRHPEEARGLFQLALETSVRIESLSNAAVTAINLSDLALQRDRYEESLSYLEQAIELARRIGSRSNEWFALSEMTYALTMLGRWEEALVRLAEVPEQQLGGLSNLIGPASGILELYLQDGTGWALRADGSYVRSASGGPSAQATLAAEANLTPPASRTVAPTG